MKKTGATTDRSRTYSPMATPMRCRGCSTMNMGSGNHNSFPMLHMSHAIQQLLHFANAKLQMLNTFLKKERTAGQTISFTACYQLSSVSLNSYVAGGGKHAVGKVLDGEMALGRHLDK